MLLRTQVFVYVLLGLRDQAIAYLRQMRAVRPDDFFVLTTLAHFLGQRDEGQAAPNRAEAITLLRQALGLQPNSAALHFNLAFLLEAQGQLPDAEAAFRRAVAIDEKLDRAWYGRVSRPAAKARGGPVRTPAQHGSAADESFRLVPDGASPP